MNKEKMNLIMGIIERADKVNLILFDRLSLMMDLKCAVEEFDLRLEDLLKANDLNFNHDLVGIQGNLNRQTKKFENCFVPRFAN